MVDTAVLRRGGGVTQLPSKQARARSACYGGQQRQDMVLLKSKAIWFTDVESSIHKVMLNLIP